ncbi:MAG: mechanosensitive ion channel family protein [Candidatus Bathyarchaeia archaeon]
MFLEIPYLIPIAEVVVALIVAVILERLVTRYLRRFSKQKELPPDVGNGLVLLFRFLIILGAVIAILRVGGLPTEWFVAFSALGGTAIGFASTRTVGNLIAGFYLLIARPFGVRDYIRLGNVEGIVEEITINYTKIRTPDGTTVSISNQRILDQDIINYRVKSGKHPLYCYSFELNFPHSLATDKLEEIFDRVIERYKERLPRKPEYGMTKLTRLERYYMFYLYVKSPRDIFTIQPEFLREITEAWDKATLEMST